MTDGKTMVTAAAVAGMSERAARKWQRGPLPSATKRPRHWRTRPDPFEDVWTSDVVPLLESDEDGVLEAVTILGELQERYPAKFEDGQLRTLQRRMREWRALHGPAKEVFFEQVHEPGREAAVDFTNANELGVTIAGKPFPHLLFHFVLTYSGWTWHPECLLNSVHERLERFRECATADLIKSCVFSTTPFSCDSPGLMRVDSMP